MYYAGNFFWIYIHLFKKSRILFEISRKICFKLEYESCLRKILKENDRFLR